MNDLIRQAKERQETTVSEAQKLSPEEARKAEIKGMNDRVITLIAESITKATNNVQAIALQAEAEKLALAKRLSSAERARDALMQNLNVMQ